MLSQQLSDRSWATLQESLHDHGEGQLIPISTITSPTSSFPQSKVQAVGGVVVAVHSVDNPWNFGVTLRDPSGEVEVCVHGAALQLLLREEEELIALKSWNRSGRRL